MLSLILNPIRYVICFVSISISYASASSMDVSFGERDAERREQLVISNQSFDSYNDASSAADTNSVENSESFAPYDYASSSGYTSSAESSESIDSEFSIHVHNPFQHFKEPMCCAAISTSTKKKLAYVSAGVFGVVALALPVSFILAAYFYSDFDSEVKAFYLPMLATAITFGLMSGVSAALPSINFKSYDITESTVYSETGSEIV